MVKEINSDCWYYTKYGLQAATVGQSHMFVVAVNLKFYFLSLQKKDSLTANTTVIFIGIVCTYCLHCKCPATVLSSTLIKQST